MDPPNIELWFWRVTSTVTGKRYVTRHRMTEEDAKAYPGAEKVLGSLEVRSGVPAKAHGSPSYFSKPGGG